MSSKTPTDTPISTTSSFREWDDMQFWGSGEEQVVLENLKGIRYCPGKKNLFRALELTPYNEVKVMICGQDPYTDPLLATGVAFSVPADARIPPTLKQIFDEYETDLHLPRPTSGNLEKWCREGVLLWNVIPSCHSGQSLSHDWEEWRYLTNEIITRLAEKGIVFVFIGSRARAYATIPRGMDNCRVIETVHPSPRAMLNKNIKHPFIGSRIFTTINDKLSEIGLEPINWRLE